VIPKVIHQIWLGESGGSEPLPHFIETARTWRRLNPSWEYRLWSGSEVEALFAEHRPDLLGLYRAYPYWVQRADAARYLILYHFGGVYADLDITCTRELDPLVEADLVLAPTEPAGISNDFMLSRRGHPLFAGLLDRLPGADRRWNRPWIPRHFRVLCSTGSLFLTLGLRQDPPPHSGLRFLTAGEYGHGTPSAAFVHHLEGNTWAAWDTHFFVLLGKHWKMLTGLAAALVALVIWGMVT
jgi:mannosyltransferase OCH1-like enzyme